jgi:subtilisin family serine protease
MIYCSNALQAEPWDWHGTHTSGLVGAVANNQQGGAGSAPNVQLMLLRVSDMTKKNSSRGTAMSRT